MNSYFCYTSFGMLQIKYLLNIYVLNPYKMLSVKFLKSDGKFCDGLIALIGNCLNKIHDGKCFP